MRVWACENRVGRLPHSACLFVPCASRLAPPRVCCCMMIGPSVLAPPAVPAPVLTTTRDDFQHSRANDGVAESGAARAGVPVAPTARPVLYSTGMEARAAEAELRWSALREQAIAKRIEAIRGRKQELGLPTSDTAVGDAQVGGSVQHSDSKDGTASDADAVSRHEHKLADDDVDVRQSGTASVAVTVTATRASSAAPASSPQTGSGREGNVYHTHTLTHSHTHTLTHSTTHYTRHTAHDTLHDTRHETPLHNDVSCFVACCWRRCSHRPDFPTQGRGAVTRTITVHPCSSSACSQSRVGGSAAAGPRVAAVPPTTRHRHTALCTHQPTSFQCGATHHQRRRASARAQCSRRLCVTCQATRTATAGPGTAAP